MNSRSRSSASSAPSGSSQSLRPSQRLSNSSKRRSRDDDDDNDEQEDDNDNVGIVRNENSSSSSSNNNTSSSGDHEDKYLYTDFKKDELYITYDMKVSDKDMTNWNKLNQDAQNLCVKRTVRYILFRSSKKESISRDKIADVLHSIDSTYKKLINPCLQKASKLLKDDFGYDLVLESDIIGLESSKPKTNYYLMNSLKSFQLANILANLNHDKAYTAFCYIVLVAIFTSPNRSATMESIISSLRLIDPRLSNSTNSSKARLSTSSEQNAASSTRVSVPELNNDFVGLIQRMKKVN